MVPKVRANASWFAFWRERKYHVPRSATVFNLGYGEEERARYPWLAQVSETPKRVC